MWTHLITYWNLLIFHYFGHRSFLWHFYYSAEYALRLVNLGIGFGCYLFYIYKYLVSSLFFVRFFVCVCLQPHSFIKRISTNKRKKTHMERKQEALLSISADINIFCGNQFCQLLIKLSMITAVSWIHLSHLFFVGYLFFRNWNLTVIILRKPFLSLRSANK